MGLFKIAAEVPLAFQSVCTFTCAPSAMAANLSFRESDEPKTGMSRMLKTLSDDTHFTLLATPFYIMGHSCAP